MNKLGRAVRADAAGQYEDAGERREDADERREDAGERREDADQRRDDEAERREAAIDRREDDVSLREKVLRAQEETANAKVGLSLTETQLREANEALVIATVRAQTMTESAELAATQMSYMAEHDILTGLPNRAVLINGLTRSIALAERDGKRVALMYLDVDHFKHVNDSLGHAVGDQLLQSVAKRLQACVRPSDTVSRQGGDEFVVLLGEVETVRDAILTAEKLIKAAAQPHLVGGHQVHVTVSIGVSVYPDDGKDAETVVRNADNAMYHAKRDGRDRYRVFTPDMSARAVARQSTKVALHRALERREFVLHYQPEVNLETGAITGVEALLRLQRFDHRLVYPAEFVSIAEDCGLILPIGSWVLREACRQAQAWLLTGLDVGQIAVNVSALEFRSKGFLSGVRTILNDTGLDPRHLELELTESGLMQDTEPTTVILQALKSLGVRIAIDDFGTGYSSLNYLRRFPIDTLKIDRSFVRDIDGDGGDAIVSAVIAMGVSLNQRVVAEGIETRQQLAFLKAHRCNEGQGYYFSRPVAAKRFAAMLQVARHSQPASC